MPGRVPSSYGRTGVACCLPTCVQGSSVPVTKIVGNGVFFFALWLLLGALCILGVLALPVISLLCTRLGSYRCASCWTRPLGGGRWGITFVTFGMIAGQPINCQKLLWD